MIDLDDAVLADRFGRRLAFDASISAVEWVGEVAWFACGDGAIRRADLTGDYRPLAANQGAILAAAVDPGEQSLLTGGDDGRLLRVARDGAVEELGSFGRHWVEHIAASPQSGLIVAAVGKEAVVWKRGAREASHRFAFASTIGGLALDAKGKRLAVTQYGGATLLYASASDGGRLALKWAGSHLACTIAPGGDYLVTAMQETGLHGWRLPDMTDMAMRGYRAKTRSFSWNRRGKWLATSGDTSAILWPFEGKAGPMGQRPLLLGEADAIVSRVAFHPRQDILAIGYADGAVALHKIGDEGAVPVEQPGGEAISALSWRGDGSVLAWGAEDGRAGLLEVAGPQPR
jgi:hypothetical protein